ncbi:hypothetical protein VKS41_004540 [Umbelopsis sp. WA50703]
MTVSTKSKFSPLSDLPLETKDDLRVAFLEVFRPLLPAFSPGSARVRVEEAGAHFAPAAADLEGFARPLWGIVPFVAGGGKFDYWDLYHEGLTNGTDPAHQEYWGTPTNHDQRQVELAAIGFAIALIPEHFYEPLSEAAKQNLVKYLQTGRNHFYPVCNWRFFRVLVDLGLKTVGASYDTKMTEQYLDDLDSYYLADGYYGDGVEKYKMDYYNPWAFQFYALIYAKLCPEDTARQQTYRTRAKIFAQQFQHWFADDGSAIPFGRSLIYRYACGSFWGAVAYADEEVLPWGVIKGLYMRHMRWWAKQPVSRLNTGLLSLGYTYPNPYICETYNSPQSPYWALKAFLPLALPDDHPFWTAEELPLKLDSASLPVPGMVVSHYPQNTVALMSGPQHSPSTVRYQAEKYCKFAYSSRYGFSIDIRRDCFDFAVLDSMIGFSEDGDFFKVRESTKARIFENKLYSTWSPWKDVDVETWLIPSGKWHIRVHRVQSGRDLSTIEGGFAISNYEHVGQVDQKSDSNKAYVCNSEDFSGIIDLGGNREGKVCVPEPNTNIMFPKSVVPQLKGTIKANTSALYAAAIIAQPDIQILEGEWCNVPEIPSIEELERIKQLSIPVFNE